MTATLGLERLPGRCAAGFDLATQHPGLCACRVEHRPLGAITPAEWATFTAALRVAAKSSADGLVHQRDVRPRVRGAIAHKHIGLCWKRARDSRLVVEKGHERSDDRIGGNAGRMEPYYELRSAA